MRKVASAILDFPQTGLIVIILVLGAIMTHFAGTHVDSVTGHVVNNFLNPATLIQVATDSSFFAIMAVGVTMVIISAGIDLSVGSIYAVAGVLTAILLRDLPHLSTTAQVVVSILSTAGIGLVAGLLNGVMVSRLGVHPFIITLGTMWIYRGIAFVSSQGETILVPDVLTKVSRMSLGLRKDLAPVPMLVTVAVTILGSIYLQRTVWGRRVFAVGGNVEAARYSGLNIPKVLWSVYAISGLAAGVAAWLGSSFYGSASSADGQGYELYVIAAAVVGGASLNGGKGSAFSALLGALLIVMMRQSIRTLHLDQNYEWIIIGVAIIVAVVLDRWSSTAQRRRLLKARM